MTCQLVALCVQAADPQVAARFWGALLGGHLDDVPGGVEVTPAETLGFRLRFVPSSHPKRGQNAKHFDLTSSSPDQQWSTVETALRLGARPVDVGQRGDEGHVVLGDVEGNEFCVIEPGNRFLADCGFVGALACDGSYAVGHFWADVLGWPLVWDQDGETAIRSPSGGPKITWGGDVPAPGKQRDRLFFHVVPAPTTDRDAEIDRLMSLGATRRSVAGPDGEEMDLSDPDGNLFRVSSRPT